MISTEQARHVAANPDGVWPDDLLAFVQYVGDGDKPAEQAAAIWPNQPGRVPALVMVREYCRLTAKARARRLRGQVSAAIAAEGSADVIYNRLPSWAKW